MITPRTRVHVNDQDLIVGIDVGKFNHVAIGLAPGGRFTKAITVENTLKGYEKLLSQMAAWQGDYHCEEIVVAVESTAHYWEPLARWLKGKGIKVVQVNPLHTRRMKEVEDNSPGKTDKKDARIIAKLARQGKYLTCILPEGTLAELRELVRIRQRIVRELTEKRNYLTRLMDSVFPEIFTIFKTSCGKTLLHLLNEYPLPEDVLRTPQEDIKATLRQKATHLVMTRLHKVYEKGGHTVGVKVAPEAYRLAIRSTVERILELKEKEKDTAKRMEHFVEQVPETPYLLSMKGMGTVVTAATLIGETGGLSHYTRAEEILKLAGMNLYEKSSGTHKGRVHITKRGRPLLRHTLFVVATLQVRKGMPFHEHYRCLLGRGMPRKKALVAISRRLLRVLFSLVRDKRHYTSEPPSLSLVQKAA